MSSTEVQVLSSGTAMEAVTRGQVDVQIATAREYPRSIQKFRKELEALATADEDTAASCRYRLPRGGKKIEGPSARFAEMVAYCFEHLRSEARVVSMDEKFVTVQGVAWDLERNNAQSVEVKRRITDKNGKRFNDDVITVTTNAAISIALRNAIFKVVPFALCKAAFEKARQVAVGDATTLNDRRAKMIEAFAGIDVDAPTIFDYLGVRGLDDVNLEHVDELIGLFQSIRDGEVAARDAFKKPEPPKASARIDPSKIKAGAAAHTEPSEAQKPAAIAALSEGEAVRRDEYLSAIPEMVGALGKNEQKTIAGNYYPDGLKALSLEALTDLHTRLENL